MIKLLLPCLLLLVLTGCGRPAEPAPPEQPPQRIISLAPNITDSLYALGLEDRLVGVSRFGSTRQEEDLPIVGDFLNINYESLVSLNPDLVILEQSSDDQKARLESLGIPYLETGSLSLADVLSSLERIGQACQVENKASVLIESMQHGINTARNTPDRRPRTLLVFGEFSGPSSVEQVYAFGADCIHSELLGIAGGDNVVRTAHPSVRLSREAILRLDPELIIELTAGGPTNQWDTLATVNAVRNHRIHVLSDPDACIPSPAGLMQTLQTFSRIIKQADLK